MSPSPSEKIYDVFLSHNSADKPEVEALAGRLEDEENLRPFLDKWHLVPGEPWQEALEEALDQSKTVAVFLGPSGISPWHNEEMRSALNTRVRDRTYRVIPVLLPGATIPEKGEMPRFLSRLNWVDFRGGVEDAEALHRLVSGIRGRAPGRGPGAPASALPDEETLPDRGKLPPGSRVPFNPNAVFTGREKDLLALWAALRPGADGKAVVTQGAAVATGMGGVGKTQLAVEFCYRYGRFYQGVHWLGADRNLEAEVAACGARMGIEPWPEELPEQVRLTLNACRQGGPRLVVLDNADGETGLQTAQEWLPRLGNAQVLLTSRRGEWPEDLGLAQHPLDTLEPSESLALLRKLAPRMEQTADKTLHPLRERLGDLPLALDLAGRYLKKRFQLSVQDYLAELENAQSSLAHKTFVEEAGYSPTGHDTSLVDTYLLSWGQLADDAKGELARRVFCTLAYCAPQTPVPWEVLEAALAEENGEVPPLDEALTALAELGLAEWGEDGPELHPLLAEFGRLQDQEREASALPGLAKALKVAGREALNTGLPVSFAPLRAHVETVAESAKQAGLTDAGDLWNDLGLYLAMVANYSGARAFYELAIKLFEESYGPVRPEVAAISNNLGLMLQNLGELSNAKEFLERSIDIWEKMYGENHEKVATGINNMGLLLHQMGDLDEAQEHFQRVLKILEKILPLEHTYVASTTNNLGLVQKDLGKLKQAKAAFERALAIWEKVHGKIHPNVAIGNNNLGGLHQELGDLAKAREHYQQALAIDEAVYGPEHPDVARDLNNMGDLMKEMGEREEAKKYLKRALTILEKSLPPDHPNIRVVRSNLESLDS